MRTFESLDEFAAAAGEHLGFGAWHEITQEEINLFADATGDHQWIHVDPERARREGPFGGPIAHGYLTLSLLPWLVGQILETTGFRMGVNYGTEKVRFPSPVPVGARVRGRFILSEVSMRSDTQAVLRYQVSVEIEGAAKPALAAEWITLAVLG